jgi:hypothetical protein
MTERRPTRTDRHSVICTSCKRLIATVDVHVTTNRQGDSNANTMARILRAVRCYDCFRIAPDLLPSAAPEDATASDPLTPEEEAARHPLYSEADEPDPDDELRELARRLNQALGKRR